MADLSQIKSKAGAHLRLDYIDGLRGLALLMVLLYHCGAFGGGWKVEVPGIGFSLNAILDYGHIGVNLFLLLSGFCLYWPYVKKSDKERKEPTLVQYALKRCRRILPPYYVSLLLVLIYTAFCARDEFPAGDTAYPWHWLAWHALMAHNLSTYYILRVNGPLWSIGLEFQLYILFPILVEAYRRFPARIVLFVVLVLCSAYRLFVDYGGYSNTGPLGYTLAFSVFGRCFEFALGMYLAKMIANWEIGEPAPITRGDLLTVLAVVALTLTRSKNDSFPAFGDAYWGLLFGALLVWASRPNTIAHRVFSSRMIVALGVISYSVYLIHLPIIMYFGQVSVRHHLTNTPCLLFEFLFVVPLVLTVSYVFHTLFEKPFMTVYPPGSLFSRLFGKYPAIARTDTLPAPESLP